MKHWFEVRVRVNADTEESILDFLFESNCLGCEQKEDLVLSYFSEEAPIDAILENLKKHLSQLSSSGFKLPQAELELRTIADRDWGAAWKKHFKPIVISDRLVVKPSWETFAAPANAAVIDIDPKQAFGTGSHESTRIALLLLEKYLKTGDQVLDVGTGTGILAIAAVKLGANHAVALDVDAEAATCARENIEQNQVADSVEVITGDLRALSPTSARFDLILANLNRRIVLDLLKDFGECLKASGLLVLSGLLKNEKDAIAKATSFQIIEEMVVNEWLGLVVKQPRRRGVQ
ncbi:MAG: 50S ribosomal protein L11 methyltransferase [bacterium]